MKKNNQRLKLLQEQALINLEKKKHDEKLTRYIKTILIERYLNRNLSLEDLIAKQQKAIDKFHEEVLWDAMSIRILSESKLTNQISYLLQEMPIDYIVRISQEAQNEDIANLANQVCYEKQLDIEETLKLEELEYIKWQLDNENEQLDQTKPHKKNSNSKLLKKRQVDLSITTRKFLQRFFSISYKEERELSLDDMEMILTMRSIHIPKRGRIQNLTYEDVATGNWVLVREETANKKNARMIPYENPLVQKEKKYQKAYNKLMK